MEHTSSYLRLCSELSKAKESLACGNIEAARSSLDLARGITASLCRQEKRTTSSEALQWALMGDFDSSSVEETYSLVNEINQSWSQVALWFDNVISTVGREELLHSSDGINIILDRALATTWDFNCDIAIVTGNHADNFVYALMMRGQSKIIQVCDHNIESNQLIEYLDAPAPEAMSAGPSKTLVRVESQSALTAHQVEALCHAALGVPNYTHISTDTIEVPFPHFQNLVGQIGKEFILLESQMSLPLIFTEQLLKNLPKFENFKSTSELRHLVKGAAVMIVSPGPSLLDSLAKIKEFRKSFIVISLMRSLPVLKDFGIVPDFAIVSDLADHTENGLNIISSDSDFSLIPLITSEYVHEATFRLPFSEFFLMPTAELIGSSLSIALHGPRPPVVVGTGVATFAVSLFAELGAGSITLIGQDLSTANGTYAASEHSQLRHYHGNLVCKGINGELLPTQDDYLQFLAELKYLGSKYSKHVDMFNCTSFGAYVDNWLHIPLDDKHPAVVSNSTSSTLVRSAMSVLSRQSEAISKSSILSAIDEEIVQLLNVDTIASALLIELERTVPGQSYELEDLERLEQRLSDVMSSRGSMISYYTLPAKLEVDRLLSTVESLESNFKVSTEYYTAVRTQARLLTEGLLTASSILGR